MHTTTAALPETTEQRIERFNLWYDLYIEYNGVEPSVITVHLTYQRYGGPEEGGWHYTEGWPVSNYCIFSREQAIEELLRIHAIYEGEDYEDKEYDINLASSYAKFYPERKPHYE